MVEDCRTRNIRKASRASAEVPLVPVMAAVANAIYNALGKRLYSLPMSPPVVLEVIERGCAAGGGSDARRGGFKTRPPAAFASPALRGTMKHISMALALALCRWLAPARRPTGRPMTRRPQTA